MKWYKMRFRLFVSLISILFLFTGCFLIYKTNSRPYNNFTGTYKKDAALIHPEFSIFHNSDSTSQLHFRIDPKELLFTKQTEENSFSANVRLSYYLTPWYESKPIIDSLTIELIEEEDAFPITGILPFNAYYGSNYLLEVILTDLKRNASVRQYLNIEKTNNWTRQNFIVKVGNLSATTNDLSGRAGAPPIFRDYLYQDETVSISCKYPARVLYVSYFKRDFPIATPPFALAENKPFDYRTDSMYVMTLKDSGVFTTRLIKEGIYHFQTDTSQIGGLTLFRHRKDFPEISSAEDLFRPLRYITTNEEYNEMEAEKNKKTAIDNFWLTVGGSKERAKELIRKFYNRVRDANSFFTSYIEGWQTDRGMIYLIYGPPNAVYKGSSSEKWLYGEENNIMSLSFTFVKVINPFTDNDYMLERSPMFKTSWYKAVDTWRQGRVY